MGKKDKFGIWNLAKKSLAVLTASLSALVSNQTKATSLTSNFDNVDKNLNYENFQKRILRPKLILKLNISSPDNSLLSMHTSHSSHSSHSSHASHSSYSPSPNHSSHASHISSSPSYTSPSIPKPLYTPKIQDYTPSPPVKNYSTKKSAIEENALAFYSLGSRILYKGCRGTDVKELQVILIKLGYKVSSSGYFDNNTELAVKNFQNINQLKVDGKVGPTTLIFLQSK